MRVSKKNRIILFAVICIQTEMAAAAAAGCSCREDGDASRALQTLLGPYGTQVE
jgi:hypothetical protein